jgi:hypothetical protein
MEATLEKLTNTCRLLCRYPHWHCSFGVRLKSVEKRQLKAVAIASLQLSTPESHLGNHLLTFYRSAASVA